METWTKIARHRRGSLNDEERDFLQVLNTHKGLQAWRATQIDRVEEKLLEHDKVYDALLPYRSMVLIDPEASALDFFENNSSARVTRIESKTPTVKENDP